MNVTKTLISFKIFCNHIGFVEDVSLEELSHNLRLIWLIIIRDNCFGCLEGVRSNFVCRWFFKVDMYHFLC